MNPRMPWQRGLALLAGACAAITLVSCQKGDYRSGNRGPNQPLQPPNMGGTGQNGGQGSGPAKPQITVAAKGVNIVQTSFLYFIADPAKPQEKCWYLADEWGQNFKGGTSPEVLTNLRPLTVRSVTPEETKRALEELQSREKGWQDAARYLLAGCAMAVPFASNPIGAVALAVCGASGTLAEKNIGDRITQASQASNLADGQAAGSVETKKLIAVFEAALKGRTGTGTLNCSTALEDVRRSSAAKPPTSP